MHLKQNTCYMTINILFFLPFSTLSALICSNCKWHCSCVFFPFLRGWGTSFRVWLNAKNQTHHESRTNWPPKIENCPLENRQSNKLNPTQNWQVLVLWVYSLDLETRDHSFYKRHETSLYSSSKTTLTWPTIYITKVKLDWPSKGNWI